MNWKQLCAAATLAAALTATAAAQTAPPAAPAGQRTQTPPAAQRQQGAAPTAANQQQAAPATPRNAEQVAAIVNDEVISSYDVRQRAALLLLSNGVASSPQMLERARPQALQELIDEHLQLQETKHFEINISDAEIDRRINDIARSNQRTRDEFLHQLVEAGVNPTSLRAQIKADMAWNRLMGGLYGSRLRISEHEVQETQARIAASSTDTHYLISEIFLPAGNEQEFAQMQNGAMRLIEQMAPPNNAPFPLVARQFSASPSAATGGDIGWVTSGELPTEVGAIINRLQPGQVSLPVRASNGIYIVALRDKREGQAAGAASRITLRQITAPLAQRSLMERLQRRLNGCASVDREVAAITGAASVELGSTTETDLSPTIRGRITNVETGHASTVVSSGETLDMIVVCGRETGGAGVPTRQEIENNLYEAELAMLSQRYLRNLRSEATIITRRDPTQQQPQQPSRS